jgi:ABC-2 type transport system permease protein
MQDAMKLRHALLAMSAVVGRETRSFTRQPGRLFSALVRPLLWLVVFAAGFQNVFGVAIAPPYETYVEYKVYIVPGLLGMIALFNGMQSSLAMVYDREMGVMRLLLTAPLPRAWILTCKLAAGAMLSFLQMLAFIAAAWAFGIELAPMYVLLALPVFLLCALMLAALGLVLSVYIQQLENFAGTMNFVIFPMFFISSALYPLWKLEESGARLIHTLAMYSPFTHAVEAMRFALYGQAQVVSLIVTAGCALLFFGIALWGYDPQRGMARRPAEPRIS